VRVIYPKGPFNMGAKYAFFHLILLSYMTSAEYTIDFEYPLSTGTAGTADQ
jgi:hypothetical protein